jgi:adenosylcobinamide kinase/adenosylcobinamide-phosphate guanylyltransferase
MARIILVTGGSRSGKSRHAQKLAESQDGLRAFIATCPVIDGEMRARVRKHQRARKPSDWHTIEETLDLAGALLRSRDYAVVLVDCVTLWVNNVLYEAMQRGKTVSETQIARLCRQALDACGQHPGTIIFVTNEVGMSIVPDNQLSRRYRDLAGRANQIIAAASDQVYFLVCGQALVLKGDQA